MKINPCHNCGIQPIPVDIKDDRGIIVGSSWICPKCKRMTGIAYVQWEADDMWNEANKQVGICSQCGRDNKELIEQEQIKYCPGCGAKLGCEKNEL